MRDDFTRAAAPLHLAPRAGRGRNASSDAFRVRGSLRERSYHRLCGDGPSPQPSPRKNGEREPSAFASEKCADELGKITLRARSPHQYGVNSRKIRPTRRHFFTGDSAFTVWTLTRRVPLGLFCLDSSTTGGLRRAVWSCLGMIGGQTSYVCREGTPVSSFPDHALRFVRSGATYVGRSRGNASNPAVMHLTGARRHDWARHHRIAASPHRVCRREPGRPGDVGSFRLQSPGGRGPRDVACAGRLLGRRRDPLDAHPRARDEERGTAAVRDHGPAGAIGPAARAAVRRAAGPDLLGRGRQPATDLGRHLAGDVAGRLAATRPRLRNLAAARAGAADGSRRRRAAREGRGVPAQPLDLGRPRHRGDGPRDRRPGHRADPRARRPAPRARRVQPALQGAAGGNRAAARFRRRRAMADLGEEPRG
ncbi:hypothetical protein ACVIM9_006476 [Bradyrhizobium sp. USDA 4520]